MRKVITRRELKALITKIMKMRVMLSTMRYIQAITLQVGAPTSRMLTTLTKISKYLSIVRCSHPVTSHLASSASSLSLRTISTLF